jgi:hypothetical protein
MTEQIFVDLGDFVPAEYGFAFSVQGRRYVVEYGEVRLDDFLRMLATETEAKASELYERRRKIVTDFVTKHLTSGDPEQLKTDLATMPYVSFRGSLAVGQIYEQIQKGIKKKAPGA